MAWVGRDLKSHEPPHLILDQAAQGPIQPGLECLQGWGIVSVCLILKVAFRSQHSARNQLSAVLREGGLHAGLLWTQD